MTAVDGTLGANSCGYQPWFAETKLGFGRGEEEENKTGLKVYGGQRWENLVGEANGYCNRSRGSGKLSSHTKNRKGHFYFSPKFMK